MHLHHQHSDQEHFDNLLDFSTITHHHHHSLSLDELSVSKDKFHLSEKQRTRQESYEQITKKINQAKLEQAQLKKDLAVLRQETYKKYLGILQDEFQQLSQENQALRAELKQNAVKIKDDKSQRLSNRSSIKVRTSINSVYGDENKKTHSKVTRNQASPNMILKKKDIKLTESTAHLGRSQIHSPKHHKRRESQLTERKNQQSQPVCVSFNDQKASEFNFKESISRQNLRGEPQPKNIFLEILSKMLKEQLVNDHQRYGEMYLQATRKPIQSHKQDIVYINSMEEEIKETNQKLQMLNMVIQRFQHEIEGMNVHLKNVEEFTVRLYQVKGKYVEMQKKCEELINLRKQVYEKENTLNSKKLQNSTEQSESKQITSIETLIKIFTNNPHKTFTSKSTKLYCNYYRQIKELFKFDKEDQIKRQQKMVKVKEMIDNIRESRRKFNELIQIYEGRIAKLEEKISRVRQQQGGQSAKSNKK